MKARNINTLQKVSAASLALGHGSVPPPALFSRFIPYHQTQSSHPRFFSTQATPTYNFVKKLIANNPKVAIIPRKFQAYLLQEIANTVKVQRFARLGGALLYPSLAASGIPGALMYTPVCVGLHQIAIMRACGAARDLVICNRVLNEDAANNMLKKWMQDNQISSLTFNEQNELVLFSQVHPPKLTASAWLDKISLDTKPVSQGVISWLNPTFKKSNNTIHYFHLAEDIREQINFLMKARSRRFRTPLLLGVAGYFLGTAFLTSEAFMSMASLFAGAVIGAVTNHHTVTSDTKKLWDLVKTHQSVSDLIAPEYQADYLPILKDIKKEKVELIVNVFGDIIINPTFTLRSSASLFFIPSNKKNVIEERQDSALFQSPCKKKSS